MSRSGLLGSDDNSPPTYPENATTAALRIAVIRAVAGLDGYENPDVTPGGWWDRRVEPVIRVVTPEAEAAHREPDRDAKIAALAAVLDRVIDGPDPGKTLTEALYDAGLRATTPEQPPSLDRLAEIVSDSLAATTEGTDWAEAPEPSDEPGSLYVLRLTNEIAARLAAPSAPSSGDPAVTGEDVQRAFAALDVLHALATRLASQPDRSK